MTFINIEIKARTKQHGTIREILTSQGAEFRGTEDQTDTYFKVQNGRLKLRQGKSERSLISYQRKNTPGVRQSEFSIYSTENPELLYSMLSETVGVLVEVSKTREVYYIDNVKFHLDNVKGLRTFVEIEASNMYADKPVEELRRQCEKYVSLFGISEDEHVGVSYSDLLLTD